jgi:methylase of polypeptide subunit release factors
MTLSELAGILTDELKNNSIEEAVLEAELLIRSVLKLSKVEYILADKRVLTNQEEQSIKHALSQRLSGIPAAYIMGEK